MVNFPVPENIGFGLARGTACCLHAGDEILDYSGHLLNLSARLMDLARPSGIVIDGMFGENLIPAPLREMFLPQKVYLRGIAEQTPLDIFVLKDYVKVPEQALRPIVEENWETVQVVHKLSQWKKIAGNYQIKLPSTPASHDKISIHLIYPDVVAEKDIEGMSWQPPFEDFTYKKEGGQMVLRVWTEKIVEQVTKRNVTDERNVTVRVQYIPDMARRS
jgi:hypothetical protein